MTYLTKLASPLGSLSLASNGEELTGLWLEGQKYFAAGLEAGAEERRYQDLWRRFYDTIAVEGRINPQLRRGNMPMRYWPNMTEFQPA